MVELDTIPLVPLQSMNETHFEEVNVINMLLKQLHSEADFESISKSFEKLLEHMQQHFSSEEKLMKEAQYPSFNMHKADHDKVLNEARYAEMQWRNKKDAESIKNYIEEDLIPWLDQHIKAMDMPLADYISHSSK
ncbi:MAG: hemerythrin family protein [Campylobacterota bacterium]|nr:hemerythrin family protein [Campylobacterota bacterium]